MKKSLFLLASLGVLCYSQAQTFYAKKLTEVKVKNGALLYVDGNMKVESSVDGLTNLREEGNGYVSNEGNIKVTGSLAMGNTVNGSDFVNELLPGGKYGQLIVKNGGTDNSGLITSETAFNKEFGYYPFAFPFKKGHPVKVLGGLLGLDKDQLNLDKDQLNPLLSKFVGYVPGRGGGKKGFDRERFKNPLFIWDNSAGQPVLKQLGATDEEIPLGSYIAFNASHRGEKDTDKVKAVSYLEGTPNKGDVDVQVVTYTVGSNKDFNKYGEQYGSYVFDFTKEMPVGFDKYGESDAIVQANGFGDNIFLLGNPYTSNINLFADSNIQSFSSEKVTAIVQFTQETTYNDAVNLEGNPGNISTSYGAQMTAATGNGTGDVSAYYVRPYQTFAVKLDPSVKAWTFKFRDSMKTFDLPSGTDAPVNSVLDINARRFDVNGSGINQVGLDLYDASDRFTGIKTYVVASDIYEASKKGEGIELINLAIQDKDIALYTLQEDEEGSVDKNLASEKAYINGVNADKYAGKPIHLVFQNGKGTYTFKARLNKDLAKNKNSFYFEDKKTGKVVKINKDFNYTFNAEGTDKDRFVLYWAKTPTSNLDKEISNDVTEKSSIVYKSNDGLYRVRFNKVSKIADVFVYNISGQLVNVTKGINTTEDYIVPVKGSSSVYIVKIVEENGKVTTQKIIK